MIFNQSINQESASRRIGTIEATKILSPKKQ
jgi:hypothetical protein